jgi:hypothetical protein
MLKQFSKVDIAIREILLDVVSANGVNKVIIWC